VTRDSGSIYQYVSLRDSAYAVGGDRHRDDDRYWYSVENVARPGEALTPAQIRGVAQILAWLHVNAHVPLQEANARFEPGLGYHSMFGRGTHRHCPGDHVIAQRGEIIANARQMAAS
jgi:hypothetical protein